MISSILAGLLGAVVVCALTYAIVKVAILTFAVVKNKIMEIIRRRPGTVSKAAVVSVQDLLDSAPEISLEDFGPGVQEEDYMIFGIKEDGALDEDADIIRADSIDDELSSTMERFNGVIKIVT